MPNFSSLEIGKLKTIVNLKILTEYVDSKRSVKFPLNNEYVEVGLSFEERIMLFSLSGEIQFVEPFFVTYFADLRRCKEEALDEVSFTFDFPFHDFLPEGFEYHFLPTSILINDVGVNLSVSEGVISLRCRIIPESCTLIMEILKKVFKICEGSFREKSQVQQSLLSEDGGKKKPVGKFDDMEDDIPF